MRIVSLLPSATEIVCAVGAAEELVGRSHECDFPSAITDRPVLTRARIALGDTSGAIDHAVRAVIRDALSLYTVDEQALAALAPDVIVTQDLCEVCAVSLDDVRRAVARLAQRDAVEVVSLRPTRLSDVLDDVERVARVLGRAATGAAVRGELERRIREIEGRAAAAADAARPNVLSIEWLDPLMIGGTWMPELIERAGGRAVGAEAGAPAPTIDVRELGRLAPEVIVVKPCGFTIERALRERALIERLAIGSARVYVTDGNAYFNRPGPRLVESLEIMAACVHPARFADFAEKHAAAIVRIA